MATLYYNGAVNSDWATLGNWWDDSGFTTAASSLPTSSDSVELFATCDTNTGSAPTVVDLTITDWTLGISITVTGTATFNGASLLSSGGYITGNAAFYGTSYNEGTVTGTIIYSGFSGYNGIYYIGGQPTTLDSNGSGFWDSKAYYYGAPQPTGWNNYFYYINDCETPLDSNGTGYDSSCTFFYYINGCATPLDSNGTGYDSSCTFLYYITGFSTTLDSNGNGSYNGSYYLGGIQTSLSENGTGYWEGIYYIEAVVTTLDSNGDGSWNGTEYLGGIPATTLYYKNIVDTDWYNLGNWFKNSGLSVAADFVGRSIDNVFFAKGAFCDTASQGDPTVKTLTLLG